jgi:NAD(P)-dependent dehydrogenase (short-subunit alcohol dehydrogenase family)
MTYRRRRDRRTIPFVEQPSFSLDGQVALVSGATRGIGHDLAIALAQAGAKVAAGVRSDGDAPDLEATFKGGGRSFRVSLDVTDIGSIRAAVDRVEAETGHIDILINNAGLGFNHDALDVTEADWDAMMAVNLKGLFFLTQAVGRGMVERGYGRIVSLSSQAGLVGIRRHAVYAAGKGAVNMLTKVLALEWAPHGVTVNAIAPTFVRTPGTAERLDDPAFAADALSRIPVGRYGTTTDLASPAAGLVTGAIIPIDGGWTAQ